MEYTIEPVTSNDLSFLSEFIHSAKLALTINRLVFLDWPNEQLQSKLYSRAVHSGYENPSVDCFKAVDNNTQEIIGYIVMRKQSAPKPGHTFEETPEGQKASEDSVPHGLNLPLFTEINSAVNEIAERTKGLELFGKSSRLLSRPCIVTQANILVPRTEIVYMCVKPSAQRHGIGSSLVQLAFDRAKAQGIPVNVCAEAPSIPFFDSIGFKETKHVDIDLRNYAAENSGFGVFRLSGMIWHPDE